MDPIAVAFLRKQAELGKLKPKRQPVAHYGAYAKLWGSTLRNAIIEVRVVGGPAAAARMLDGRKFSWPPHIAKKSQKTQFVSDFLKWAAGAHPAHFKKISDAAAAKGSHISNLGALPAQTTTAIQTPSVDWAPALEVLVSLLPAAADESISTTAPAETEERVTPDPKRIEVPGAEGANANPIDAHEEKLRKQRERLAALNAANEQKRLEALEKEKKALGA